MLAIHLGGTLAVSRAAWPVLREQGYCRIVNTSRLTAESVEFGPVMEAGFPASKVAPFTCTLASREVPCTAETFVVGGGRAARVVLATAPGLRDGSSITDCLARFDEALAIDDLYVPDDAAQQVLYECRQIGLELEGLIG